MLFVTKLLITGIHYLQVDIALLYWPTPSQSMARVFKGSHRFTCHSRAFIHKWNEPYLPLLSRPKLVVIYRRAPEDGRLR